MTNVPGTTPIQWTDGAGGADLAWISDPLLAGVTISGTITLNIRGSESNNNDNVQPEVRIYKYSGGSEGAAFSTTNPASEFTTSETAKNWTDAAPTSTAFSAGDRIVVKVFAAPNGSMTAGTANIYINGAAGATGDSYVSFTENIAFIRTRTVKPSGGDYATLNAYAASTGEAADLVTLTEVRQAECYAMSDTTAVTFNSTAGWVTSATYYIKVYTPTSERSADGIYNSAKYELNNIAPVNVGVNCGNIWFDGIQFVTTASSGSGTSVGIIVPATLTTGGTIKVSKCIFKGVYSGTASNDSAIQLVQPSSGTTTLTIWDCIIYNYVNSTNAMNAILSATGWTINAYNNTVYNCRSGYNRVGTATFIVINCAAMSCNDGFVGTFDATSNYNASDIASDSPGANSQNGSAATFVNAAGGNFKPAYTDTVMLGNATTDPGSGLFSDDIISVSRSAPWDIGAFVAQAAPVAANKNTLMMVGYGI